MEVLPLVDPSHPLQHVGIDINGTEIGAVSSDGAALDTAAVQPAAGRHEKPECAYAAAP